jgi:hypothetical protein
MPGPLSYYNKRRAYNTDICNAYDSIVDNALTQQNASPPGSFLLTVIAAPHLILAE